MEEKTVKEIMEAETVVVENGIEYYEEKGLYFPKLILGDELESNVYVGRWGREWMRHLLITVIKCKKKAFKFCKFFDAS